MTTLLERPLDRRDVAPYVDEPDRPPRSHARLHRLWRGRPDDPAWVRPLLLSLLVVSAFLYLWDLSASGWANGFYSAAVEAGSKSWKAFFFGSFDSSNFITVDKPPAFLWVMEISARIFGLNSWSILVPNALEGVATVGVVYLTVRRWFGPAAGLIGGAVLAVTPVAALMFRYNNPDSLLALLLALSIYFTVRAIDDGRSRWIVLAGTVVGFAFLTKMMQAFMVLPAIGITYMVSGPGRALRRIRQLLYGLIAMVAAGGWWVVIVEAIPKSDRPYVGSSQNDSLWTLIFGYNGLGRLTGSESGSVGGGTGTTNRWGITGLLRLFGDDMGSQISWLLPAALILLVAGLIFVGRTGRRDRRRAGLMLWGLTLLVTAAILSFGQGIIHPYYTVALAAPIAALIGIGTVLVWQHRQSWVARGVLSVAVAATTIWSYVLWGRSPGWHPDIRIGMLVVGLLGSACILGMHRLPAWGRRSVLVLTAVAVMAGPLAFTADTVTTAYSGSLPLAGPTQTGASAFGGGGGGGGGPTGGGAPSGSGGPAGSSSSGSSSVGSGSRPGGGGAPSSSGSGPSSSSSSTATGATGTKATGTKTKAAKTTGTKTTAKSSSGTASGSRSSAPSHSGSSTSGSASGPSGGSSGGAAPGGSTAGGTSAGSLLTASSPDSALVKYLERDASKYTWIAATVGANDAAGYELSTDDAVMAIGGFNGSDPTPTLAQFKADVAAHQIHYFIAGNSGGAGGSSSSGDSSAITSWVEAHFTSTTVGGVKVYDLSSYAS